MKYKNINRKTTFVISALVIVYFLLMLRLTYLQYWNPDKYKNKAFRQRKSRLEETAPRGKICDRNGSIFAITSSEKMLWSDPSYLTNSGKATFWGVSKLLAQSGDFSDEYFYNLLTKTKSKRYVELIPIMNDTYAIAIDSLIKQGKLPGVFIRKNKCRLYPQRELLGSIIGFCNNDGRGATGIEYEMDKYLQGVNGWITIKRSSNSQRFYDVKWKKLQFEAEPGHDVYLTIDQYIQHIVHRELLKGVEKFTPLKAAVIVMKPKTGEILAISSWPDFDPEQTRGTNFFKYFENIAVAECYEPGSTMKVISGAMALNEGTVALSSNIFCENGQWRVRRGRVLRDDHNIGMITFKEVIQKSSNIGIAKAIQNIDNQVFYDYLTKFGFGKLTGVKELYGEKSGTLRRPEKWTSDSKFSLPMGHEISVTALQMLNAVNAIANQGTMMEPKIIQKIMTNDGKISPDAINYNYFEPQIISSNIICRQAANDMIEAMSSVVEGGTGSKAAIEGYHVAGKTGTAQKFDKKLHHYSHRNYVSSFVGFAPATNPEISCIVVFDSPRKSHYGGTVAATIFKEICKETLAYLEIPKDFIVVDQKTEVVNNDTF